MYSRGSEWRKWDLHIHTPKSIVNNYGGDTDEVWEKYISTLEHLPSEVKVLGITDYYFIDGYEKVMEYKLHKGRLSNIEKIFPILEFRIDTFGSGNENKLQKINLHILFDVNESDLRNEIQKIKDEFITIIPISSLEKHKTKMLSKDNLTAEGGSLRYGFDNFIPNTQKVFEIIDSDTWRDKTFMFLGYKEWSNLEKNQQLKPLKEDLYSKVGAFFTSQINTLSKSQEWLNEFGYKKLLHSLDIHDFDVLDSTKEDGYLCHTWIKADPTFEGLKQILYEPERVRIQENNPYYEFDKPIFTEICINKDTPLFSDSDICFERTTIPLNSGLVSIIGGRGTGKSRLIDYIANGLGKDTKIEYLLDSNVVVKRKAGLNEAENSFFMDEDNHIDFMYIPQSEIKTIVEKRDVFSRKIRETIGVQEEYQTNSDILEATAKLLTEYESICEALNTNGSTSPEKKETLDKEIKKYKDYIANITSEENKAKLEHYKKLVEEEQQLNKEKQRIFDVISELEKLQRELNSKFIEIENSLKEKVSDIAIPQIDASATIEYLKNAVLVRIGELLSSNQKQIEDIKEQFKDYTGDIASLLDNVKSYQEQASQKAKEKELIEKSEARILTIRQENLKEIGEKIKNDINLYTERIEQKWQEFKTGKDGYSTELKQLLDSILSEDEIDVHVEVHIDTEKMYYFLQSPLDKRSWKMDALKNFIKIQDINDFYDVITQVSHGTPEEQTVVDKLSQCGIDALLLPILYKNYPQYITHDVFVTSHGRPITKLSHGQQGTIYLRLQLAANLFYNTIIYDQPEDDLDNDFITHSLVQLFRKIKQYRQVIIVSHNANLVVNGDSEQVIIANNNEGKLSYTSGSLENKSINTAICNILEGGETAFEKREQRYGLK